MSAAPERRQDKALRIAVIGAGVIGLACALELGRRGASVTVYERGSALGDGATARAAGMLGAGFDWSGPDQGALAQLARRASELWPDFAARLGPVEFSTEGALVVARSEADERWTEGIASACGARGLPAIPLSAAELISREPAISGPVRSGLLLTGDRQVDAEVVLRRLAAVLEEAGAGLRLGHAVERVAVGSDIRIGEDRFDRVILATGTRVPPEFVDEQGTALQTGLPDIVPVKGQMLALAPVPGRPRHVIHAPDVYIAPKSRWVLVGATLERGRSDTQVDPEAIGRLKRKAAEIAGGLGEAPEVAVWAGIRPGTPDDAPLIGRTAIPGVFAAMGHYRNGVLLAPATAEIVAGQVIDGEAGPQGSGWAEPFDPLRFDKRAAPSHSRSAQG